MELSKRLLFRKTFKRKESTQCGFGNSPVKQKVYLTRKEEEEEVLDLTRKDGPRVTEKEKSWEEKQAEKAKKFRRK